MTEGDETRPALTGWRLWVAGARPRTLPAAVVPVLVGTAAAAGVPRPTPPGSVYAAAVDAAEALGPWPPSAVAGPLRGIIVWRFVAALVVALAIQVGTNYANDYSDGKRGTDDPGHRTGPPRLVGWGLAPAGDVKRAAALAFGVAAVAGLALAAAVTWWLIPLGLVCFAAGWLYTGGPRPYGYAGLGEVFVFVFFGLVATMGSAYVQAERLTAADVPGAPVAVTSFGWLTLGAAVAVGCLATALLVVNNLRDIPGDTAVGKRTLAVKLGDRATRGLYTALMVAPFLMVPVVCGLGGRPLGAVALVAVLLGNRPVAQVLSGARGPALVPVLVQTGRVQLVFGVLLAAGLFLSVPS